MTLDETALDDELTALEATRSWSPRLIARLEALLRTDDDERLLHVNPLKFAREHRVAEAEAIDLFLHATRQGLFEMAWRVVCPVCALALESFASLRRVENRLFCEVCHTAVEARLDDFIQVSFTVAPKIRKVRWHSPATLSARDYFFRYRFAAEAVLPGGGGRLRDLCASTIRVCEYLEPKSCLTLELDAVPGTVSAADPMSHADFVLTVSSDAAAQPQRVRARLEGSRFVLDASEVRAGKLILEIENPATQRGALLLSCVPTGAHLPPVSFEPFLTGGRVLTQQTFRRLFRSEVIQASEGIGVRELTVLFTDLKGSTALYERIGDFAAFSLVRQHFEMIGEVVQAFEGAVVKTIGDAVMAVFDEPSRAVKAAARMLEAIDAFNRERGMTDLVLKIGLHRGPSIAVTLNENVDYFGQTVNVAARVQGLAAGGEICFTETIFEEASVATHLPQFEVTARDEKLKGVEREVRVYAARRAQTRAAA